MSAVVLYFSASGNSLSVARDLAAKMDGQRIAIPSLMDQRTITIQAEVVGIVFPVYHATFGESGVPQIVERFIGKLENMASSYLFAVCTHGGQPGATMGNFAQMIASRRGELAAGFTVKMSYPYTPAEKLSNLLLRRKLEIHAHTEMQERQKLFQGWQRKLDAIIEYISARKRGHLETRSTAASFVLAPWIGFQKQAALARYQHLANTTGPSFGALTLLADKSFQCNELCSGCGTCARVCPVNNIKIVDQRPVWQHRCENCYACFQWCPKKAIQGENIQYEKRYHHPQVKLADLLVRNEATSRIEA